MPPVFIQPGLGDSLNRYLERLGRRGEEQRRLTAQRDNLQARMDARAAEVRTRMISDSINQTVGLFTDEMQRDRASQRRITEGEAAWQRRGDEFDRRAYQKNLPDTQMFNVLHGLKLRTHDSLQAFTDDKAAIPALKARIQRQREDSPYTLSPADIPKIGKIYKEMQALGQHLRNSSDGPARDVAQAQADYVRGMLQQFAELSFEPNGPPKQRPPEPTLGTGMKSPSNPDGNNLARGYRYDYIPNKGWVLSDGEKDRKEAQDSLADLSLVQESPAFTIWKNMTTEEQEQWQKDNPDKSPPNEKMSAIERLGFALTETDVRKKVFQGDGGDATEEEVVAAMLAYNKLGDFGKKPAGGGEQPAPALPAMAFFGLPQKKLDALVKEAGRPVVLKDERGRDYVLPNKEGKPSAVLYLGNGEVELVPLTDLYKVDPGGGSAVLRSEQPRMSPR